MTDLHEHNISWVDPWEPFEGIEPWEDYEPDPEPTGCAYCDAIEVREWPEPFGGQPCCEACFNVLIGGEADDSPFRCSRQERSR